MIKSILKPTIPLSPPKQIPPHKTTPKDTGTGPNDQRADSETDHQGAQAIGHATSQEPEVHSSLEEQQKAAAREKEKKDILERRDARRKSLGSLSLVLRPSTYSSNIANRRVSFAPEATLHTWDIVELPEDATSSSEATNSTRRASMGSTLQSTSFAQQQPEALGSEPPSTPPKAEVQVAASPAHQRDLHQKKHRRSSGIPPMDFNNPEDFSSSPTGSMSSEEIGQSPNATDIVDASEIDSDEDKDTVRDDTVTGTINEDMTARSEASMSSDKTSGADSSAQLDKSLRQAAQQAGAYNVQQDATGEVTMDLIDDDVSQHLHPIVPQSGPQQSTKDLSSRQDQGNINPFSPAFATQVQKLQGGRGNDEMTMEMTQAIGGIIPAVNNARESPRRSKRKSMPSSRRRSSVGRRRSSGDSSVLADETMEFATTYGGIQHLQQPASDRLPSDDEDEEMTMELTTVMGGVMPSPGPNLVGQSPHADITPNQTQMDMDMDITAAVGRVLSPVTERTEPSEDGTLGMDITRAVGSILPDDLKVSDKSTAKMLMEEEVDHGQLTRSPFPKPSLPYSKSTPAAQRAFKTTDTGSPEAIGQGSLRARSPAITKLSSTPVKTPGTPSKQVTPQPVRPTTPSKTPPSKNVSMRRTSPKKLFKAEIKKAAKSPKAATPNLKFSEDIKTGQAIPDVVLTPPVRRRISGIGIDQDGIGSPRMAALLDRRTSIVDSAENFAPKPVPSGGVRFEDPIAIEQELDKERAEDERRESGRGILERESDSTQEDVTKDLTANLKDMIQSLTPKKNRLRGRKSLAGSAKGLLGKRPIELDEEDEDATPKRLRGKERSPVKSIHLPGPPLKDETVGRLGKAPKFVLSAISGNVSTPITEVPPPKTASTPEDHGRFRDSDMVKTGTTPPTSFNEQLSGALPEATADEETPLSLQDFLNMTNIRFMDLTTTKRRHTVAPKSEPEMKDQANDGSQLADAVATGACTIPMLDLFQHVSRPIPSRR